MSFKNNLREMPTLPLRIQYFFNAVEHEYRRSSDTTEPPSASAVSDFLREGALDSKVWQDWKKKLEKGLFKSAPKALLPAAASLGFTREKPWLSVEPSDDPLLMLFSAIDLCARAIQSPGLRQPDIIEKSAAWRARILSKWGFYQVAAIAGSSTPSPSSPDHPSTIKARAGLYLDDFGRADPYTGILISIRDERFDQYLDPPWPTGYLAGTSLIQAVWNRSSGLRFEGMGVYSKGPLSTLVLDALAAAVLDWAAIVALEGYSNEYSEKKTTITAGSIILLLLGERHDPAMGKEWHYAVDAIAGDSWADGTPHHERYWLRAAIGCRLALNNALKLAGISRTALRNLIGEIPLPMAVGERPFSMRIKSEEEEPASPSTPSNAWGQFRDTMTGNPRDQPVFNGIPSD